jgi:hypothetical protein
MQTTQYHFVQTSGKRKGVNFQGSKLQKYDIFHDRNRSRMGTQDLNKNFPSHTAKPSLGQRELSD